MLSNGDRQSHMLTGETVMQIRMRIHSVVSSTLKGGISHRVGTEHYLLL